MLVAATALSSLMSLIRACGACMPVNTVGRDAVEAWGQEFVTLLVSGSCNDSSVVLIVISSGPRY
jgi:hypothetical protein